MTEPSRIERIGQEMRFRRKGRKLSMREVGEMVGVETVTVQSWEKGYRWPSLKNFLVWCEVMEVNAGRILT